MARRRRALARRESSDRGNTWQRRGCGHDRYRRCRWCRTGRPVGAWGSLSARDRGRCLARISHRIVERIDEFARLETLHNGKPIFESRQIEMPAVAECFEYYAGWADKIHGKTIPIKGNYLTYTLREPIGVVAAIIPWNFPLLLTA